MKPMIKRRLFSFLLIMAMLVNTFFPIPINATVINLTATVNLTKTADVTEMRFNESGTNEVNLSYTVQPSPIPASSIPTITTEKEIVMIIDKSGSMSSDIYGTGGSPSRMSLVKSAATSFLDQFSNNSNVKVSLVEFSTRSDVYSIGGVTLLPLAANKAALKNKINGLSASGGTNIGDAIRQAYYTLNAGSATAKKYIVLLTDGEPTAFSLTTWDKSNTSYSGIGAYYYYNQHGDLKSNNIYTINSVSEFNTGSGAATNYFVNWTSTGDYKGYSLTYAKNMAAQLLNMSNLSSYFIAFSDEAAANKLQVISAEGNGIYKKAMSASEIDSVYADIAKEINADVLLSDVDFKETFPDSFEIIDIPTTMSKLGQTVTGSFSDIVYSLNTAKTHYEAAPITFSIKVAAKEAGTFVIGANNTSEFSYIDLDNFSSVFKYFSPITIVVKPALLTTESNVLNILELQPGRNFELNKGAIETAMPGYTINLVQMSMPQFNGLIDPVNGLYDIVYIGKKENYSNYTVSGSTNSITANIDITDRKAAEIKEFINSGQLTIFDQDIFSPTGTKLESNFKSFTNTNVHKVADGIYTNFAKDISTWYDAANHRPFLNLKNQPKSYDGTAASFSADNIMSYSYDATNGKDNNMSLNLYMDYNGDGIFTTDEKVKTDTYSKNILGTSMLYSINDSFNGCMPWKIELVDSITNTKDYHVGFTAFTGTKTIVNVLQLIPSGNLLDIGNSTQFKKPLNSEDYNYQINITKMNINDFQNNFPNPVNGKPTVLNGNYDMIIFGFSDSYSNNDLNASKADVLAAINKFIETEQSILFTHDTAGPQDANIPGGANYNDAPVITTNFKDDMGFSNTRTSAGIGVWKAWNTSSAFKFNEGLITQYPYVLANNSSSTLAIATTHDQYWNIDLEDSEVIPWFTLNNNNFKYYPLAYYYTFSKGNITYSGTGHSTPSGIPEQELFVNTMLKASRGANHAPTFDVNGLYEGMNVMPSQSTINFDIKIHDIDFNDTSFKTQIYLTVNGTEKLVKTITGMEKEKTIPISLNTSGTDLTENVDAFKIKLVVSDDSNAESFKEYNSTHLEFPSLTVDTKERGFLIGDPIDLIYKVTPDSTANLNRIQDMYFTATFDSTALQLVSLGDWTGTAAALVTSSASFSSDFIEKTIHLKASKVGFTVFDADVQYLSKISDAVSSTKTLPVETNINIVSGRITAIAKDNLKQVIPGATIVVTNSAGVEMGSGLTKTDDGSFTIDGLKSDTYTVKILTTNFPAGYSIPDVTTVTTTLEYGTGSVEEAQLYYQKVVTFEANDLVKPVISATYSPYFVVDSTTPIDIHVKADGVKSKIVVTAYKVWPITTDPNTITVADFADTASHLSLEPDSSGTYVIVSEVADMEVIGKIPATANGWYVIYTKNLAGNEEIKKIKINNFITDIPNIT